MLRYDTIIFDLDGTLLDTLDDLMDAVNHALAQMGFPARSRGEVQAFVGNGVAKLMERAVPAGTGPTDTAQALDIFKSYYAEHSKDKTAPYPGIPETLKALRDKGCRLSVVSNKFDAAVKALARDYFPGLMDLAAGENEAGGVPKKPDPTMVLQTMAALNASPERTVYVGDSDVDLETAKNAGLSCISVTWGFRDREFLLAHGATVFADFPAELLSLIDE
ncbi:MAG: HAD family hydrolase [Oscillospiraceae bacterium]|jgi:phosphoglycolate phosphatase|nr:HAD family hydrolase [Oscillospiraceae bacterium]